MADFALLTPTAVPVGQSIPFNTIITRGCCCIKHRTGSGSVKLKGGTCCKPNRYRITFHADVTGVVGAGQLGIYLDGDLLPETAMNYTTDAATDVTAVDSATEVEIDGCYSTISVRNILGTGLTVNVANIIVNKGVA